MATVLLPGAFGNGRQALGGFLAAVRVPQNPNTVSTKVPSEPFLGFKMCRVDSVGFGAGGCAC